MRSDDNLGTIREQIELQQRAAILVAPHGSNEVFDIGVHRGACKIEMLDVRSPNFCYARLAFLSGLQYNAVSCTLKGPMHVNCKSPCTLPGTHCLSEILQRLDTCVVPEGLEGGWKEEEAG